jgi:GH25 family lysozyme M1 (1,4-beta-N-acetylmuramidase)
MTIVDISYWQNFISQATFEAWKAAGVTRVIHKAGGAESGRFVKDSRHDSNVAASRAAGLGNDHYFFNGPLDPAACADQFAVFANAQSGDRMWFDIENSTNVTHWNPDQCMAAVNQLKNAHGLYSGLYMSSSVTHAQNWQPLVDAGVPLWVAQYGSNDGTQQGAPNVSYWPSYVYFQYTSVGHLPGYGGNLDLNTDSGLAVAGVSGGNAVASLMVISQPGVSVKQVQQALINHGISVGPSGADDVNGPATTHGLSLFQTQNGLTVDLNVGPNTWAKLSGSVNPAPARSLYVDGSWGTLTTKALQLALHVPDDGVLGPQTYSALQTRIGTFSDGNWGPHSKIALQAYLGVRQDGTIGPISIKALQTRLNAGTF